MKAPLLTKLRGLLHFLTLLNPLLTKDVVYSLLSSYITNSERRPETMKSLSRLILVLFVFTLCMSCVAGYAADLKDNTNGEMQLQGAPGGDKPSAGVQTITLNSIEFEVSGAYQFFTWSELPSDVIHERNSVQSFTGPDGQTHYYEAI